MSAEGVRPPGGPGKGGGLGGCEKPPQKIECHWWGMMDALPSQVLRPLRDATKKSLSLAHRRRRRNQARDHLEKYATGLGEWMESVDAMMRRHGAEHVDIRDQEQAEAFHSRLTDSERKALSKCQRVRTAIAYARFALEFLDWELADGR